jgi:hypothetical protein
MAAEHAKDSGWPVSVAIFCERRFSHALSESD